MLRHCSRITMKWKLMIPILLVIQKEKPLLRICLHCPTCTSSEIRYELFKILEKRSSNFVNFFQKNLKDQDTRTFPSSRNLESAQSTRSAPGALVSRDFSLDRHNLGLVRPRKLTPLERLPRSAQIRIGE